MNCQQLKIDTEQLYRYDSKVAFYAILLIASYDLICLILTLEETVKHWETFL